MSYSLLLLLRTLKSATLRISEMNLIGKYGELVPDTTAQTGGGGGVSSGNRM